MKFMLFNEKFSFSHYKFSLVSCIMCSAHHDPPLKAEDAEILIGFEFLV
jgi:hypothetical protein